MEADDTVSAAVAAAVAVAAVAPVFRKSSNLLIGTWRISAIRDARSSQREPTDGPAGGG